MESTVERADLNSAGLLCINFKCRKSARAVTASLDRNLAPTGITSTQFSVMVGLAYYPRHSMSALANFLVMDRTTLTKNLKPLMRDKLIALTEGEDKRQRLLELTKRGKAVLDKAFPLWTEAQQQVSDVLGGGAEMHDLYRTLHKVSSRLSKSELALKN